MAPPTRSLPRPLRWIAGIVVAPLRGDRPLILAVLASLVAAALLLVAPAQRYLEAQARVDVLDVKDRALAGEVDRLEQRIEDLHDPQYLELIAREQQGFVRPGEVAYRIVPPEPEHYELPRGPRSEPEQVGLHERVWSVLSGFLGIA